MAQAIRSKLEVDPILAHYSPEYIISKSGNQIQSTPYTSNSDGNGGSLSWSNITPEYGTFVNRKITMNFAADFTLTAANGYTGSVFPGGVIGGVCALKWAPVQSNATAITLTLNGAAYSINGKEILEPISRFGMGKNFVDTDFSIVPAMHDVAQYSDSYNTNLNPLADLFVNSANQPRGAFEPVIVSDANGVAVLHYEWSEYLMISPLIWSRGNQHGLFGLKTVLLNMTYSNLENMLSYDNVNGTELSSIVGAFSGKSTLYLQTITPIVPVKPETQRLYPYVNILPIASNTNIIASGASTTFTTNNQQLTGVPSKLFIYARRQDETMSPFNANTYAYISAMTVKFGNLQAIFSTYTEQDLYRYFMADQGFQYPFNMVKNYLGSVLCIDFGTQVPTGLLQSVGQMGQYNFTATITMHNLYPDATAFNVYVIPFYDGIISIKNSVVTTLETVVSKADVLQAEIADQQEFAHPNPAVSYNLEGGDFLGQLKRFGQAAVNKVRQGINFYGQNKDAIDGVISSLIRSGLVLAEIIPELIGAGYNQPQIYSGLRKYFSEVELMGAGLVGGALVGGCNGVPCNGGQLITDPNQLLTGGSMANKTAPSIAQSKPRRRLDQRF